MKSQKKLRSLTLYACYGALLFAAKMMLAALPNVEPVTLMVILLGSVFGPGSITAVLIYIFLEVLIWGVNIWVVSYFLLWPALLFISCLLKKSDSAFAAACLGALFGYGFGALCALTMIPVLGIAGAIAWWQSGVLFDLIHGTSNFILVLLLYKPLRKLLIRLKESYFS